MEETARYFVEQLFWNGVYENEIRQVYEILKDQENRIFDLCWYDMGGDVMDYVQGVVSKGQVFVVKDKTSPEEIAALFMLDKARTFGEVIVRCDIHTAVRKKYWGKQSREIMEVFRQYVNKNFYIKKIVASVPQCGYGVIKLLKDIGFTHEGTLRNSLLFHDKNKIPKWYDELIYSLTREDI